LPPWSMNRALTERLGVPVPRLRRSGRDLHRGDSKHWVSINEGNVARKCKCIPSGTYSVLDGMEVFVAQFHKVVIEILVREITAYEHTVHLGVVLSQVLQRSGVSSFLEIVVKTYGDLLSKYPSSRKFRRKKTSKNKAQHESQELYHLPRPLERSCCNGP
jgi:hypothetical protein